MSEPRRLGELLPAVLERARRIAIIGELVGTFHLPEERKQIVMSLYEGGVITEQTAELLVEHFGLEAA